MENDNILQEAIAEARTLRELSLSNAKHSLKKFLLEEKLPLDDFDDIELDLDTFVDLIVQRARKRDEEGDELNPQGLPYMNCKHKMQSERARIGMRRELTDDDELIIDYGEISAPAKTQVSKGDLCCDAYSSDMEDG